MSAIEKLYPYKKMMRFISQLKRIGINGLKVPEVTKLLKLNNIAYVIDIRENTFYKTNQGFSPKEFKEVLDQSEIKYFRIKTFANPFHKEFQEALKLEPDKKEEIDEAAKTKYSEYLESEYHHRDHKDFFPKEKLDKLFDLIAHKKNSKDKIFCFLCYCQGVCHTYWLIEKLINLRKAELGAGLYIMKEENYHKFNLSEVT